MKFVSIEYDLLPDNLKELINQREIEKYEKKKQKYREYYHNVRKHDPEYKEANKKRVLNHYHKKRETLKELGVIGNK